ncbi:hypothetical protein Tco_1469524, partial [Tanacetum coccineum]
PRTNVIVLSSNESSPTQNIPLNTTLDTTLALTILPPIISQTILSQRTNVSPLVPRALVFSTPPSSPREPHPYLTYMNDLPPRNSNPLPSSFSQGHSQGHSQTLPIPTPMDFEPSFPPINLSRRRMCAHEPFLSRNQVMQQLRQIQDFDRHIESAIQNVQNSLLPPFTTTSPQMPPPFYFTSSSTTTIPPFRPSLPPLSTFYPLDQSLWMEGPVNSQPQEHTCPHCQRTETLVNNLQNEMRFMLNHILECLNHISNHQPLDGDCKLVRA